MARHPIVEPSDEMLVKRARRGETHAYGQLWERHARAGIAVARHFVPPSDAEDVVSEAFMSILHALRNGHGPTAAFRPYLFATIRNLGIRWSHRDRAQSLPETLAAAPELLMDDAGLELDVTLVAFSSLPERWQAALWYSEVEGLEPRDIGPLLGVSAHTAASLAFRAREGLRSAWIQAQVAGVPAGRECSHVRSRLGDLVRGRLSRREHDRAARHLVDCAKCQQLATEARGNASRIASLLGPLILGPGIAASVIHLHAPVVAAAAVLPAVGSGSAVALSTLLPTAALPAAVTTGVAAVAISATLALAPAPPLEVSTEGVSETVKTVDSSQVDELAAVPVPEEGTGTDSPSALPSTLSPAQPVPVASDSSAEPPGMTVDTGPAGTVWARVAGFAEGGATVTVTVDGTPACVSLADEGGSWGCSDIVTGAGTFLLAASQVDPVGNLSLSTTATITLEAPQAEVLGASCAHGPRCNLQVSGVPGAVVEVLLDGAVHDYVDLTNGGRALTALELPPGSHLVIVRYVVQDQDPSRTGPEVSLDVSAG